MALIEQPGPIDRRKPGGQIKIERQTNGLDRSPVERGRVPR